MKNEINKRIKSGACDPIEVYRCSYCDKDSACGFDEHSYDHSGDECHHPFTFEEARRLAACWNYCEGIATDELEKQTTLRNTSPS